MTNKLTSFTTPASLSQLPDASVVVCAHDAGAAAHIAAWLEPLQQKLRLCLSGPAELLIRSKFGSEAFYITNLDEELQRAQLLISGTGWESDLEHRSRLLASQFGIPSIAVLDHWVNYSERFEREGVEQLPDALWVADEEAAALAISVFPSVPVFQLQNHWLESICKAVQDIRFSAESIPQPRRPAKRLLYLLEPIRVAWSQTSGNASELGEFQALRFWLQQLPRLIDGGFIAPLGELEALALRPHPSEPIDKYDSFISEASSDWPIKLDRSPGLAAALAWTDVAFGCETQALVAATACNVPSFSTIPPWAPSCRLPQRSLHHLNRLEAL